MSKPSQLALLTAEELWFYSKLLLDVKPLHLVSKGYAQKQLAHCCPTTLEDKIGISCNGRRSEKRGEM